MAQALFSGADLQERPDLAAEKGDRVCLATLDRMPRRTARRAGLHRRLRSFGNAPLRRPWAR